MKEKARKSVLFLAKGYKKDIFTILADDFERS